MILRCAIDDGVRKWEPGTVLAWYPEDAQLNWGEYAHFLCLHVDSLTDIEKEKIRKRELKIDLSTELTAEQFADAVKNRKAKTAIEAKEIKTKRKNRVFKPTDKKYRVKEEIEIA